MEEKAANMKSKRVGIRDREAMPESRVLDPLLCIFLYSRWNSDSCYLILTPGDDFVADFGSVSDGSECALALMVRGRSSTTLLEAIILRC